MALKAIFRWENNDATRDLNDRFKAFLQRGIFSGGLIIPVSGSLEVDIQPFIAIANDGMMVEEDDTERLSIPLDQTTIISIKAKHVIGDDPTLEYNLTEASTFSALLDKEDHIVVGAVTVSSPATEVTNSDISYDLRDENDDRGRSRFRGRLELVSQLPTGTPNRNLPGDFYMINQGTGDLPELYAWNGVTWLNITNTLALQAELTQHRNNLFPNEIHLTDDQADAALGSSGSPSAANRYTTETDTRLLTQDENDAAEGSHGSPSSSNLFITEEFPVAAATEILFALPPGGPIEISGSEGPTYVGSGPVGSANILFSLLDFNEKKGYTNSIDIAPQVIGVFTDALLTQPLNPGSNINVDSDGFYTGDLYLQVDSVVDSGFRLNYGRRRVFQNVDKGYTVRTNPGDDFVPSKAVEKITNIKGRPFNQNIPDREQNVNLRLTLDSVQSYLGTVLETNVIAQDDDYRRLSQEPVIGDEFERNVGILPVFTFENTGLTGFSYNGTLGRVTYNSPVNLSGVRVGDLFIDGNEIEYVVAAFNDGTDTVDIVSTETGLAPSSIFTGVGSSINGSIKVNNNPRDLLLSEMKFSGAHEIIPIFDISPKTDEFSKPDGKVAYGVKTAQDRFNPRLVLYGGWENFTAGNGEKFVRNNGSSGEIVITGFFTDVLLVVRRKSNGPALDVSVDNTTATTVSTSALGQVASAVTAQPGEKYHRVVLATGLATDRVSTIKASIVAATGGSLDIYGVVLLRSNDASVGLLEPGRAFQATEIVRRDFIDDSVPIPQLGNLERGGRVVYGLEENSFSIALSQLVALDTPSPPGGFSNGGSITVTNNANLISAYRVGDIIQIHGTGPLAMEIRRILSISGFTIVLDSATSILGTVTIRHVASTDLTIPNVGEEDEIARYIPTEEFLNGTSLDFNILNNVPNNPRYFLSQDGHTLITGEEISIVTSPVISGAERGFRIDSGGFLRLSVTATRLDIVAVNEASAAGVLVSIDGSPNYTYNFVGGGAKRRTIFFNARYQSHDVVISGGGGNLAISQIILWGPQKPALIGSAETADLSLLARYSESLSYFAPAPNVHLFGGVFHESLHYITPINGVGANPDWSENLDFSKAHYGKYVTTENDGAIAEFVFEGTGFELQHIIGPDHGVFKVDVNGTDLSLVGGTIVGNYNLAAPPAGVPLNSVDGYSATYSRKNIGVYGLPYGVYTVEAYIENPRSKNDLSSGFLMAFTGYYVVNGDGYMSRGIGSPYSGTNDSRATIPVELDAEVEFSLEDLGADIQLRLVPTGTVIDYAGPTPPPGYLLCDGSEVNRSALSDLFSAVGESWGEGDGVSTFRLPDLRGYFVRGADGGAGVDPEAASRFALYVGGNTGDNVGSYQIQSTKQANNPLLTDSVPDHNHPLVAASGHTHTVDPAGDHDHSGNTAPAGDHGHSINPVGNHRHNYSAPFANEGNLEPGGPAVAADEPEFGNLTGFSGAHGHSMNPAGDHAHGMALDPAGSHAHSTQSAGSHTHTSPPAGAHSHLLVGGDLETRPKNVYMTKCIKT